MESVEKYISVKALADHMSVARSFIYKMVSESRIPFYKAGSKYLFKLSEVERRLMEDMHYA